MNKTTPLIAWSVYALGGRSLAAKTNDLVADISALYILGAPETAIVEGKFS